MTRTLRRILTAAALGLFLTGGSVSASNLTYDGFAGYSDGNLPGQAYQGSGLASGGAWSDGGAAIVTSSTGLSYGSLITTGGKAQTAAAGFNQARADFDLSAGGPYATAGLLDAGSGTIGGGAVAGTVFFSFLGASRATDLPNGSNDFNGFQFFRNNGGTEVLGVGNHWSAWAYSIFGVGGDRDLNSATPEPGQVWQVVNTATHLFVGRITFNAGAADDLTLWLDPVLGTGEAAQPAALTSTFTGYGDLSFAQFKLRSGSDNNDNGWDYDEVRVGTTFASVIPIPEPASLALLTAGALALLRRRHPAV